MKLSRNCSRTISFDIRPSNVADAIGTKISGNLLQSSRSVCLYCPNFVSHKITFYLRQFAISPRMQTRVCIKNCEAYLQWPSQRMTFALISFMRVPLIIAEMTSDSVTCNVSLSVMITNINYFFGLDFFPSEHESNFFLQEQRLKYNSLKRWRRLMLYNFSRDNNENVQGEDNWQEISFNRSYIFNSFRQGSTNKYVTLTKKNSVAKKKSQKNPRILSKATTNW